MSRLIDELPTANRPKPMEVLVLGLSRTGTMSLKVALEKLGYSVYHMSEACMRSEDRHLQLWQEALNAKFKGKGEHWTGDDLDKVLRNYNAIEDIPCILFVDELLEKYPDAKVVLTNRDVDSWMKSFRDTFLQILGWKTLPWIASIDPIFWGPYHSILTSVVNIWTNDNIADDAALRQSFKDHYAHVRSLVPKERLLEYKVQDGWEPLCSFLGKSAPGGEAFPRVNDAKWTVKLHHYLYYRRLWGIGKKYVITSGVLLSAIGIGYWRMGK
ncbi:hypothetical protein K491DRAFT_688424 [Lophiostoma macrostomum CBS 122681]|uniref:NAD dependent epimerase/dehydratase n=1 Tax=Lophiostoma macrostomum CBS 122681 TaxID=1314788 RepID=A0A6A6TK33_9PLEO|nr:hypothetical protein K491DRAFT_688424 [Lophiostoma macrostomum CBS 122681]